MIVRLSSRGSSFKGLAAYLTHDPKADTAERVAWTHTLNLANDDVPGAVNEMLWTARDAEILKQEAGIRAGGRATENPVKHISLNWSPDDDPDRAHMINAGEDFLRAMKWHEHQALLIAHDDKKYSHVHIMLNMVHPETGLKLDEGFEQRRAQAWALEYERENGRVYCEQRLKEAREREAAPPRNIWTAFQDAELAFASDEKARAELAQKIAAEKEPASLEGKEWKILKEFQQREREEFFAAGKSAFSQLRQSIYAEVREEFRDTWAQYYRDRDAGLDAAALGEIKAKIISEQSAMLAELRDPACAELRASRDEIYQALLDDQRQTRGELRGRQQEGWDNASFFDALDAREAARGEAPAFREAAEDTTRPERESPRDAETDCTPDVADDVEAYSGPHAHWGSDVGASVGRGMMSFFEAAFRAIEGAPVESRPKVSTDEKNAFAAAAAETSRREQHEREVADDEWRRRNQEAIARD